MLHYVWVTFVSKDFSVDNIKKLGYFDMSIIFQLLSIIVDDILNIHKYLMKKHEIEYNLLSE